VEVASEIRVQLHQAAVVDSVSMAETEVTRPVIRRQVVAVVEPDPLVAMAPTVLVVPAVMVGLA
jgi:hypothetical protein